MSSYGDLEIGIRRRDDEGYLVEYRYKSPGSAAESHSGSGPLILDPQELRQYAHDPEAYGRVLTQRLFADREVARPFAEARSSAESLQVPLRVRLLIHPDAAELHVIHWETLRDPRDGLFLGMDENFYLSRYTLTPDYRPVRLRLKSQLNSIVTVANPSNLEEYGLAALDVTKEANAAMEGLGPIPAKLLPAPESDERATLDNLIERLRKDRYDIVYIVCHGSTNRGESWLWLEQEDGTAARTSGEELVEQFKSIGEARPNLVVLASCESAADTAGEALTALGPRLAAAGVPVVMAMQGQISLETVADFMPVFFRELQQLGVVDRAMAVARGRVRNQPDFWMPVLFMRLEEGRIWSGFRDPQAFRKWPSLTSHIADKKITPILGSGLVGPILGSHKDIAQRWSHDYGYPMFAHERDSLPQVTQYLSVDQYPGFPGEQLEKYLRAELQSKFGGELPGALLAPNASLDELINAIGANRRQRVPWDAYKILASLELPVYITANLNKMLESALEEAGKRPRAMISPWNEYVISQEPMYGPQREAFGPTPETPLVYHLFGRLNEPDSVVLTEDDHFKYLIGVTKNADLVPTAVQEALTNRALLFLGFRLEDWNFRVLFQSLLSFEGEALRKYTKRRFVHIAVQLEPEGLQNPEIARNYLEKYFGEENINLYWGSTEEFIKELLFYLQNGEDEQRGAWR